MKRGLVILFFSIGSVVGCGSDAIDDLKASCAEQLQSMLEETGREDIGDGQVEQACVCVVDEVGGHVGVDKISDWVEVHATALELERDGDTRSIEPAGMRARALMNAKIRQCIQSW